MDNKPKVIAGSCHTDERGAVRFFNDFDLTPIKRLYLCEHFDVSTVRAWQAHQFERKWFYVSRGEFQIVLVHIDDWNNPSLTLPYEEFVLKDVDDLVLNVPAGHATGFRAMLPNSQLTVFSDFTLEQSKKDDFRFDKELWYKW